MYNEKEDEFESFWDSSELGEVITENVFGVHQPEVTCELTFAKN